MALISNLSGDRPRITGCRLLVLLTAGLLFSTADHLQGQISIDDLVFEPVITGFVSPDVIANAGDGSGRLFIAQQAGQILIYDGDALLETPFLDISERVGCCGEMGLLGLAFHPSFAGNGLFFVNFTDNNGDTNVSRFSVSADPNVADADSEELILKIPQPDSSHNGGQLEFGPDSYLYIATGDGGPSNDPQDRAQDRSSLLGKILRIDVDGEPPYGIPDDNPFAGDEAARGEIWALGFRNPWRFSFDRMTGDLFIGDVDQDSREEINFLSATSAGGENYGWSRMEGSACFDRDTGLPLPPETPPEVCNDGSLVLPALEHFHEGRCGGSIIGGYVYRGAASPTLVGHYLYGDFCKGELRAAIPDGAGGWAIVAVRDTGFSITTFGEDEEGEIFVADLISGTVFLIRGTPPPPALSFIAPSSHVSGGGDFEIVAQGSFAPASVLQWNGEARPTYVFDTTKLRATISAADVAAPGVAEISIFTPPPGGGVSPPVEFPIPASPDISPSVFVGGVAHAATYRLGQPPTAGSLISVFGTELSAFVQALGSSLVATGLGGAVLTFEVQGDDADKGVAPAEFDGQIRAALLYASPRQINAQVPRELQGLDQATLRVQVGSQISEPVTVPLAEYSPGCFTFDGVQGAVTVGNSREIAAPVGAIPGVDTRPATAFDVITLWCTGLGPVTNEPQTGEPAQRPFPLTTTVPVVTIGAVEGTITYSGIAPNSRGLNQINVKLPADVPAGDAVPVVLTIGGVESNTITIAVE